VLPMGCEAGRLGIHRLEVWALPPPVRLCILPGIAAWLVQMGQAPRAESGCRKFERSMILWRPGCGLRTRTSLLHVPAIAMHPEAYTPFLC